MSDGTEVDEYLEINAHRWAVESALCDCCDEVTVHILLEMADPSGDGVLGFAIPLPANAATRIAKAVLRTLAEPPAMSLGGTASIQPRWHPMVQDLR